MTFNWVSLYPEVLDTVHNMYYRFVWPRLDSFQAGVRHGNKITLHGSYYDTFFTV